MSEQFVGVVDPDVQAQPVAQEPPPVEAAQEPPAEPAQEPPAEDDIPEAVEVQPGVRVVPVGVVKALRDEIKALKPQAQRTAELEQQVNQFRPYADFLQANPHILNPQQPQQAPVAQADDPALVEYARTLDLYTPDGKPDTTRAAKLRDMTRAEAQAIAQQAIAPIQEVTHEQRAATNIQAIVNSGVDQQYIAEAVRNVLPAQMPKQEALRVMADPAVSNLIRLTAMGLQAAATAAQPAAPTAPPLYRESPGGAAPLQVSEDHTRKLGVKHDEYVKSASRYVPGKANSLE